MEKQLPYKMTRRTGIQKKIIVKNSSSRPLTPKQEEFAKQFVFNYCNGTVAYKKTYGTDNDNVAAVEANRLLRNPKIQELIEKYKNETEEATGMSPTIMVQELLSMTNGSVQLIMSLNDLEGLSDSQKRSIKKIKRVIEKKGTTENSVTKETIEVEFYSKLECFKLIADILGYRNNSKAPVVIVNNNLFQDSVEEFQNAIEL